MFECLSEGMKSTCFRGEIVFFRRVRMPPRNSDRTRGQKNKLSLYIGAFFCIFPQKRGKNSRFSGIFQTFSSFFKTFHKNILLIENILNKINKIFFDNFRRFDKNDWFRPTGTGFPNAAWNGSKATMPVDPVQWDGTPDPQNLKKHYVRMAEKNAEKNRNMLAFFPFSMYIEKMDQTQIRGNDLWK